MHPAFPAMRKCRADKGEGLHCPSPFYCIVMQTPLPVLNMRPGHPRPSSRSNAGRGETGGIIFAATDEKQNRNAMERIVEFPTDRTVISTENNGFAGDERDETLIDENLVETEIPLADRIPGAVRETEEGDRPIYDEEGYRNDPGGE